MEVFGPAIEVLCQKMVVLGPVIVVPSLKGPEYCKNYHYSGWGKMVVFLGSEMVVVGEH